MAYRNKTYVCFDGDNDIQYYRLMCAWKQNNGIEFSFYNAHDLSQARDSSQEASIKAQLRERLKNSKVMVVLIGENTKNLYKFVRWEMEQALIMGLPIIAVNLNKLKEQDNNLCPAIIRDELVIHIPFGPKIMQYALEHWPASHATHVKAGRKESRHYLPSVYNDLGL